MRNITKEFTTCFLEVVSMTEKKFFTSESVTEGHPDNIVG